MSFTGRLRNYGRFHGALGAGFAVFLVLFIIGFAGGLEEAIANVGEYGGNWIDVFTYAGTAAVIIAILAGAVVAFIWYNLTTDKQCDEWDETTSRLDGRYYLDEGGNAIPGSLVHYDYLNGIVWEQWNDADGYHVRTIRKLTKAEMREDEILRNGGTGRIQYHE